jgi:hypothetical protein
VGKALDRKKEKQDSNKSIFETLNCGAYLTIALVFSLSLSLALSALNVINVLKEAPSFKK